jgi:hypothetical protein
MNSCVHWCVSKDLSFLYAQLSCLILADTGICQLRLCSILSSNIFLRRGDSMPTFYKKNNIFIVYVDL